MERRSTIIGIALAVAASFGMHVGGASAATLFLAPSSVSAFVGQSVTIGVSVASPDQAMNAAQGTITFPTSKLEVVSLSTANSIINLWVQPPSFSNKDGVVNFQGVSVNPGFKGNQGRILTITFRARATGSARVAFTKGAILANDGLGTSILTDMQGSTLALKAPPPNAAGAAEVPAGPAPTVISIPAVESGGWYNFDSITFVWTPPANATGVQYALATSSDFMLPSGTLPLATEATFNISSLSNGPQFFLLKILTENGWSSAGMRSFQLDHTPPDPFTITTVGGNVATDPRPSFFWTTSDRDSGLAFYMAKIGDGDWFDPERFRSGSSYVLPLQSPTHARTLAVRAYDRAGNFRESTITFRVLAPGSPEALWDAIRSFLSIWGELLSLITFLLALGAYLLFYNVVAVRRRLRVEFKTELESLRTELQNDLQRIEGELGANDPALMEREAAHLEEDLKRIDDL